MVGTNFPARHAFTFCVPRRHALCVPLFDVFCVPLSLKRDQAGFSAGVRDS
jgi:hypothetical protein